MPYEDRVATEKQSGQSQQLGFREIKLLEETDKKVELKYKKEHMTRFNHPQPFQN